MSRFSKITHGHYANRSDNERSRVKKKKRRQNRRAWWWPPKKKGEAKGLWHDAKYARRRGPREVGGPLPMSPSSRRHSRSTRKSFFFSLFFISNWACVALNETFLFFHSIFWYNSPPFLTGDDGGSTRPLSRRRPTATLVLHLLTLWRLSTPFVPAHLLFSKVSSSSSFLSLSLFTRPPLFFLWYLVCLSVDYRHYAMCRGEFTEKCAPCVRLFLFLSPLNVSGQTLWWSWPARQMWTNVFSHLTNSARAYFSFFETFFGSAAPERARATM